MRALTKSRVSMFAMGAIRMHRESSMSKIRKMPTIRADTQYLKSTKTGSECLLFQVPSEACLNGLEQLLYAYNDTTNHVR